MSKFSFGIQPGQAGEERFRALTPMYYKSAEAILLAFSLIDSETFENLPKWIREID